MKIVSFDPALSNFGIAQMTYDWNTGKLALDNLILVQTEGSKHKTVRKNSDDLERARQLHRGMIAACEGATVAIAEIPTGTQSARGAMSNGIALGVLASCPLPLIEVSPTEAKMAAVGFKTASKGEMIQWAMAKYPNANWITRKSKGVVVPVNDCEHLADAVAIAHAGIQNEQFKLMAAVFRRV